MKKKLWLLTVGILLVSIVSAAIITYYAVLSTETTVNSPISVYEEKFVLEGELNNDERHKLLIEGNNKKDFSIPVELELQVKHEGELLENQNGLQIFLMSEVDVLNDDVDYEHPADVGSAEKDCFTNNEITCITRDLTGAPYNDGSGFISWGCGECGDVDDWYSALDGNFKNGCVDGNMQHIVGVELCLQTDNIGQWNIEFSSFQSGGGGEFAYNRKYYNVSEESIILDNGIYLIDWLIPSGQFSKSLYVKGDYNLEQGVYEFIVMLKPR